MKIKLVGLAGTLSSGKDTVAEYLAKEHGFVHVSTGDIFRAEKRRVFNDSAESILLRNDPYVNKLRRERGPGVVIDLAMEELERNPEAKGLVASGIRAIGEAERIHELGGIIIFVDAEQRLRYERAYIRNRDHQDSISFEEFKAQEASESENIDPEDKNIQNLPAMHNIADEIVYNDGGIEDYIDALKKAIARHIEL